MEKEEKREKCLFEKEQKYKRAKLKSTIINQYDSLSQVQLGHIYTCGDLTFTTFSILKRIFFPF